MCRLWRAVERGVPILPGIYSPTEALTAWRSGAMAVKLVPAYGLQLRFVTNLLAPLPMLCVVPTGWLTLEQSKTWLAAGAVAVGVKPTLIPPELIAAKDRDWLSRNARGWVEALGPAKR